MAARGRSKWARVVGIAAAAALVASGCLARYPYLTDATTTSETVNFATGLPSPAPEVTYGTPGSSCTGSTVTAGNATNVVIGGVTRVQWQAQLTGLSADTQYCYRMTQQGADLLGSDPSPSFRTPPATGDTDPYSFAVIGDWGAGTTQESDVLARLGESATDFIVTTGDNAYPFGTQTDWGDLFNNGRVFGPNNFKRQGASRAVFPTMGNHGYENSDVQATIFPQTSLVAASGGRYQTDPYCCVPADAGPVVGGSLWYAFDWGDARFYVLQSAWKDFAVADQYQADFETQWNGPVAGCPVCGTQRDWLEADLAAHATTEIKLAFFHFPMRSDALHGSDTYLTGPGSLEELLATNGVDITFNGHDHSYQRNLPAVAGTDMVSYVTGGGGQAAYPILTCSPLTAYAVGGGGTACNGPARTPNAKVYHFLKVTVNGTQVTVAPTDSTGETFDVQTFEFGP